MNAWVDGFLWWAALMGLLAWVVPNFFWKWKGAYVLKLPICFIASVATLLGGGALLSFTVHSAEIGYGKVFQGAVADPIGAAAYFLETGVETGAIWLLVLLSKLILLSLRYWRVIKQ